MSSIKATAERSSFDFEGKSVRIEQGDTVASALYRSGVRTFSRSFKYHRKRGMYCNTGDCANCLMTVDGEPAVRTCTTPAATVSRVDRGNAWPSADFDVMKIIWHLRALLPVGFYYKSMIRPRWLFPIAEKVIRRVAGIGPVSQTLPRAYRERKYHHPDLVVIGGGIAGLAAVEAAASRGESVLLAEEHTIGGLLPRGSLRARVEDLHKAVARYPNVTVLERATAIGVFEGNLVAVSDETFLHLAYAGRVVVATGASEQHAVFAGSDLPGVWLGRGAARLAGVHRLCPGSRIVIVASTHEGIDHLATLHAHASSCRDCRIVAAIVPTTLASGVPKNVEVISDGEVLEAKGHGCVKSVVVRTRSGIQIIPCDALVVSLGVQPRNGLLRQAVAEFVRGAGEVVTSGCSANEAAQAGREAALEQPTSARLILQQSALLPSLPSDGIVCTCEDVSISELEQAWQEGYRSTELLKRYTTVTMGACQGALCHPYLRAFVCNKTPHAEAAAPTTARPPARPVRLEDIAAGAHGVHEQHTALHARHLSMGATMELSGVWARPSNYGNVEAEYLAVRTGVSVMDLSTLGKYRVSGPDAADFLERIYPCRISNIKPWRSRYGVLLNEAGYIFDDGMVCALGDGGYYLTFTSSGGDGAESWLRGWQRDWGMRVHIANVTASQSVINLCGPRARDVLSKLTFEEIDARAIPYGGLRNITVAGGQCLAIRVGFVGELSYELHHTAGESEHLWDALLEAGSEYQIRPHGLDALKVLRLEKGHIIVGQDTDFDTTPAKAGLDSAVKMDKPEFVGRAALARIAEIPRERSLLPISFPGEAAPREGAQLFVDGTHAGYLTSSRWSSVLRQGVALGWLRHPADSIPARVTARDHISQYAGVVTTGSFYDPKGDRLRA